MTAPINPVTAQRVADQCAVYRMLDSEGHLLYVGKTGHAGQRFGDHSAKRWFPLVATITLKWYATEGDAAEAEMQAIHDESPLFNVIGVNMLRRRLQQPSSGLDFPVTVVAVPDVLSVFGTDRQLHWQTVAERLAIKYPERWFGISAAVISAKLRALGVPSIDLRERGERNRKGCRRADVVAAGTRLREAAVAAG